MNPTHSSPPRAAALALAVAAALAGCSSINSIVEGDRIDYRSQAGKTPALEVPPDLSQLARESRYQPQAGAVSATAYQGAAAATTAAAAPGAGTQSVAMAQRGPARIERSGSQRWLVTDLPPEQLWPVLRSTLQDGGLAIEYENAEAGVIETAWAENRAKIPTDIIRNTIGRVLDSLYSTGERDKFRIRVERTATGSEVYVSHRGLIEVYTTAQSDQTMWTSRPSDPSLEAVQLSRLLVKLGQPEEAARSAVAGAPEVPARARIVSGQPAATLEVDESFERAWRRVGVALDRSGFTVEDRDRAAGLYYVRYIDPTQAAKAEPGFFSRMFGGGNTPTSPTQNRYRIAVRGEGSSTMVSVQSAEGAPEAGEVGQQIVGRLADDLR